MIKKIPLIAVLLFISLNLFSQTIVNVYYVGDKGVTENINEANFFILIKSLPEGGFQRLDYKFHLPLLHLKTYSDSALKMLNGPYYSYKENGLLQIMGQYKNNKKDASWYYYNDTFKVVKEEKYVDGVLMETIDPDTVKKEKAVEYPDEREGDFKGGQKAWAKYLTKTVNPDVASKSVNGGEVRVAFMVDKEGTVKGLYLRRSVEFILDEEALRVIGKSPKWIPAFQNGHTVNAYRVQPLTFSVTEN